MAEKLNLKLRIRPGEAKRGCTKTLTTGGMRLTIRVPAGTTSGRVLILRAVPFPIGARDVAVKIEVKRKTGWLWACLAAGAAAVILHLSGLEHPVATPKTTAVRGGQTENRELAAAMERLYQIQPGGDTASARVEQAILRLGSWQAEGGSGPRGYQVSITAPDMAGLMESISESLAAGELQAATAEEINELILRRLEQGDYTMRKQSVMVQYTEGEDGPCVEQTEALADAVYGGLLSWQQQAIEAWRENNP